MIDLHMHTTYSDGSFSLPELLQRAEEKKLSVISVTDHNTVRAYNELKDPKVRKLFSGKIIRGVEIGASCDGNAIEILSFGHDIKKIEKKLENYCHDFNAFTTKKMTEKLCEFGLDIKHNMQQVEFLLFLCKEHKDFLDKFDKRLAQNLNNLWREGFSNSKSPLGISFDEFYLPYEEIIKIIKDCGGKAFLAHPCEYRKNAEFIIAKTKNLVDGIECFHPNMSKEYSEELIQFAQANGLLISGGSDFHGKPKPDIDLGVGRGDLHVPENLVSWIKKERDYK